VIDRSWKFKPQWTCHGGGVYRSQCVIARPDPIGPGGTRGDAGGGGRTSCIKLERWVQAGLGGMRVEAGRMSCMKLCDCKT
jgi:hypothetical protein